MLVLYALARVVSNLARTCPALTPAPSYTSFSLSKPASTGCTILSRVLGVSLPSAVAMMSSRPMAAQGSGMKTWPQEDAVYVAGVAVAFICLAGAGGICCAPFCQAIDGINLKAFGQAMGNDEHGDFAFEGVDRVGETFCGDVERAGCKVFLI